jgi:hypothetical protein
VGDLFVREVGLVEVGWLGRVEERGLQVVLGVRVGKEALGLTACRCLRSWLFEDRMLLLFLFGLFGNWEEQRGLGLFLHQPSLRFDWNCQ